MSTNRSSKKSKFPTKEFRLIKETSIGGVIRPKGFKVKLTKESEIDFRKKNRIE